MIQYSQAKGEGPEDDRKGNIMSNIESINAMYRNANIEKAIYFERSSEIAGCTDMAIVVVKSGKAPFIAESSMDAVFEFEGGAFESINAEAASKYAEISEAYGSDMVSLQLQNAIREAGFTCVGMDILTEDGYKRF